MLTILMPVYGREAFTRRFLHYSRDLPYRILIADEQDDDTLRAYYRKMAKAVQRMDTPYAMMADNDDFPARYGIDRAMQFLDANPDYISCRGRQVTFRLHPLASPKGRLCRMYWDEPHGDCRRLRYAVYRTPILAGIWQEIYQRGIDDIYAEEDYFWQRAAQLGRNKFDPSFVTYYSQAGTGIHTQRTWRSHFRFIKRFGCLSCMKRNLMRAVDDPGAVASDLAAIETAIA